MNVVIIEDERRSADGLIRMIQQYDQDIEVTAILGSVAQSKDWFRENSPPDLLLLDIQLSDGTAFDLLKSVDISTPVIFTTAYDQYAIKAFKYNSIDYLLKPLDQEELNKALDKFRKSSHEPQPIEESSSIQELEQLLNGEFKKRFLVKLGEQYRSIEVSEIAYFRYENGLTYIHTLDGQKYPDDHSLDNLDKMLHPLEFFRINRKMLIALKSIKQIHTYFNSRLLLKLTPDTPEETIVSRDRVNDFKRWMDV